MLFRPPGGVSGLKHLETVRDRGVSEMAKSSEVAQFANALAAKFSTPWQALTKALFDDYRPERHYMRGLGPRWHEKHDRAEIDRASPLVSRALAVLQP
jgi:hypothetical protein